MFKDCIKITSIDLPKQSDQKAGNVSDKTGGSCRLGVDLGMATGTDHVRWGRPNRDDCGDDGWATALLRDVGRKGTGRRYTSDGLCVTGRSRLRGHRETVRWRSLFTHTAREWMVNGLLILEVLFSRFCCACEYYCAHSKRKYIAGS